MKFWKMHGAGNDFILTDNRNGQQENLSSLARAICDRHFGVGADGLMAVENSTSSAVKMNYYNQDGSHATMCGNGIRCFAKFVFDLHLVREPVFTIETGDGEKTVTILASQQDTSRISVNMGSLPEFHCQTVAAGDRSFFIAATHFGVPHGVIFTDQSTIGQNADQELDELTVEYGPYIEKNQLFPDGINVNFVQVRDNGSILVSTWERGAGKTLACGTGACASAAAAHVLIGLPEKLPVQMPGGRVIITLQEDGNVNMEGDADLICTGEFLREGSAP